METKRILIVTKTYPTISKKYSETVCTAGILLDKNDIPLQWIRIYPIRYRDLNSDQKYPKWGIIEASIERNSQDSREESYRIDDTSIQVIRKIGTSDNWAERMSFIEPLTFNSIDEIKTQEKSLGVIRPTIEGYTTKATERDWPDSQKAVLDQGDFTRENGPFSNLEKIPYSFYYKFKDGEDRPHICSIIDWEICELYRKSRDRSLARTLEEKEAEALEKVRMKLVDYFQYKRDIYFLMGNLKKYRKTFVIIGIIYPPKERQLKLI